jgi:hypothetical protein
MASLESLLLASKINACSLKTCGNYYIVTGHGEFFFFFFFAMTVKAKERKIEVHRQKSGLPMKTTKGECWPHVSHGVECVFLQISS